MVNVDSIRTAVGIIGNVISFGLFASPIPTFIKICKAKSVAEFKSDPYTMTLLNCAMWVFYGLPFVKSHSILVSTINGIGLVMEAIYITMFFIHSDWRKRRRIIYFLMGEAVIAATVIGIALGVWHAEKQRSLFVGIVCMVLNVFMYLSPLTVMKNVIKKKSVKYMPFWLSLANLLNGVVWVGYASLKFDYNVVIPNGIGTLSGLVQLALYAWYYRSTNWEDEDDIKKPSEIQFSENNA